MTPIWLFFAILPIVFSSPLFNPDLLGTDPGVAMQRLYLIGQAIAADFKMPAYAKEEQIYTLYTRTLPLFLPRPSDIDQHALPYIIHTTAKRMAQIHLQTIDDMVKKYVESCGARGLKAMQEILGVFQDPAVVESPMEHASYYLEAEIESIKQKHNCYP